ncbi:MAG: YfiT family bacillithiol transferase [Candidatus Eisenbacteria bacterium]
MQRDPRYPLGPFTFAGSATPEERAGWIDRIAEAPARLRAAVAGLDDEQLETPYREGGWTVRQVAHHLPDSHMHACLRFRLALTEDGPAIRPYDEDKWARLHDARTAPVEVSLRLLDALHERWVPLLRSLSAADFARGLVHPEHPAGMTLEKLLALYAWHGHHHVAQIEHLLESRGWARAS